MHASDLLKLWREAEGLTQTAAAEQIAIAQPTYSDYENGKKTPRTPLANRIARLTKGKVPVEAWGEDSSEQTKTDSDAA